MKIVLTGGGSGGHITPLLAVAEELKKQQPDVQLVYIGERGSKFKEIMANSPLIAETYAVSAGKFRRYHGDSWLKRLFDVKTNFYNIRDLFRVGAGFIQSHFLLKRLKPDGVFMRGGFVSLIVCKTAGWFGIPYVIHEADTVPSLTIRLLADKAAVLATGMPKEFYKYPKEKTFFTGIPISSNFQPVTDTAKKAFRKDLGLPEASPVVFVTGGSLGAQRLNTAVIDSLEGLVKNFPELVLVHQLGKGNASAYSKVSPELKTHVRAEEFITDLYKYSGAADVVVTRAGATAISELAAQHKPCVVVPNPQLTDGHQTKNAEHWAEKGMVIIVNEKDLKQGGGALTGAITDVLGSQDKQKQLSSAIAELAKPQAARELAMLLITTFNREGRDGDQDKAS